MMLYVAGMNEKLLESFREASKNYLISQKSNRIWTFLLWLIGLLLTIRLYWTPFVRSLVNKTNRIHGIIDILPHHLLMVNQDIKLAL